MRAATRGLAAPEQSKGGQSAATGAALMRTLLELTLFSAFLLLVAGLVFPAFSVRSLLVYQKSYSVLTGIKALYDSGEVALALILALFSVLLPVAKLVFALALLALPRADGPLARRLLKLLQAVSKWAMADVLVVAVTIVVLDGGLLTAGDLRAGALFYAASVLVTSAALLMLPRALRAPATPMRA